MKTKDMVFIALFSVIMVICAWISIPAIPPLNVPFTLQTFAIFAALLILGAKRATISILLYILLGLIGLPVFSGFKGGVPALAGPTGGYIIGFILMGLVYWPFEKLKGNKMLINIIALLIGLVLCYTFGTLWFVHVYSQKTAISISTALAWCVLPFIIPDLIKLALAFLVATRVKPVIDKQ